MLPGRLSGSTLLDYAWVVLLAVTSNTMNQAADATTKDEATAAGRMTTDAPTVSP